MTDTRQSTIDKAADIIRADDSVIAGAVLAMAALRAHYDNAIATFKATVPSIDTSKLEAAIAEGADQAPALANAIAINTVASDEVHADNGGTGDTASGSVVDPATVDTSAVTTPTAPSDQAQG